MQILKLQLVLVTLLGAGILLFWTAVDSSASDAGIDYKPEMPPQTGLAQGGDVAGVSVSSGLIDSVPGSVVVTVTATIPAGTTFGFTNLTVSYDPTVVSTATANCTANPEGDLDLGFCYTLSGSPEVVRIRGRSFFGVSGPAQITLATITFNNVAVISATTNLTVSVIEFTEPGFFPPSIPYTTSDGTIIVLEDPTAIDLAAFSAVQGDNGVTVYWETGTEIDNAGFNLYRVTAENGPYTKINPALIPAKGDVVSGAGYSYLDAVAINPETIYYYKLEDIDFNGVSTFHGPINTSPDLSVEPGSRQIFLPLVVKD